MIKIGVTQRVDLVHGERRDALDQRWTAFLVSCGLTPVLLPNHAGTALSLIGETAGILLTGGNTLHKYGGDAPERDAVEFLLLELAIGRGVPVLGVCRGMQMIQDFFGVRLGRIEHHAGVRQEIRIEGNPITVNSYHEFGTVETRDPLDVWACAPDGVVKAIRHRALPIRGIMWHMEREAPFAEFDLRFVKSFFGIR